jgi:SAM-dependent methyltransferase
MHPEAFAWVRDHAPVGPVTVLDLGGRDVNGSPRNLFDADSYTVLDIADGPNVDIVADAATWTPDREYDVVVCCECFEHTPVWPQICKTAFEALKPGGEFIVTTAGPGRQPHSGVDGGILRPGEYYANIDTDDLAACLRAVGFTDPLVDRSHNPEDVRAYAVRN